MSLELIVIYLVLRNLIKNWIQFINKFKLNFLEFSILEHKYELNFKFKQIKKITKRTK